MNAGPLTVGPTIAAPIAPTPSFKTIQPIKQEPPRKPSILGPLLSGFTAGVTTGYGVKAALN